MAATSLTSPGSHSVNQDSDAVNAAMRLRRGRASMAVTHQGQGHIDGVHVWEASTLQSSHTVNSNHALKEAMCTMDGRWLWIEGGSGLKAAMHLLKASMHCMQPCIACSRASKTTMH